MTHHPRAARRSPANPVAPAHPAVPRAVRSAVVEPLEDRRLFAVNPAVVDLLIAYTGPARDFVGGETKLTNKVNRAVADLNEALANSQVNVAVRVVGLMQTSYADPGGTLRPGIPEALRVLDGSSPDFADVRAARAQTGADIVHVIENSVGGGAQAGAASVSQARLLNADLFLHELGHALGGGHLPGQGAGAAPYAQASTINVNGVNYGTLINGRGIDYYSNPNVLFRGVPTGTADTDNARAMNEQAAANAARSAGLVADAAGPLAGLGAVTAVAGQNSVTVKVIYYDGSGVDVTTLGNANLQVTGPGGLNATATFVGVDTSTGAAPVTDATVNRSVTTAVYTVATPGAVGRLSDYAFAVGGSPARDVAGNPVAGGALLSASGDTSPTSASATPLLPRFGGNTTGIAAELGDLTGNQIRLNDWVGTYYLNNSQDWNLYHFSLSAATTINATLAGSGARILIFKDGNPGGNIGGDSINQLALEPGNNYYLQILPSYPQTAAAGNFTVNLTASGTNSAFPPGGTVTGRVFNDANGDGRRASNEFGFDTPTNVRLTGTDSAGGAVNLTTTATGFFGAYTFANVPVSNAAGYTITADRRTGLIQRPVAPATGNGAAGAPAGLTFAGVTVAPGATLSGYDFGQSPLPPATTISGDVWDDSGNNDGVRDAGEAGVGGATLRLTGSNVAGDAVNLAATTNPDGTFQFSTLPSDAAGYTIAKVQPFGFVSGKAGTGTLGGTVAANNDSVAGVVVTGAAGTGYRFAVVRPAANQPAPIPTPDGTTVPQGGTVTIDILGNDAPVVPVFDLAGGFAGATTLALNGSAVVDGASLRLTNLPSQAGSAYFNAEVNVQKFNARFAFNTTPGPGTGDGLTFFIQSNRATALGGAGGGMGYSGVGKSVAVKFDLFNNVGEGGNSTGLYLNGAAPGPDGSVDLTPSGIDLHNGNTIAADVTYNGGTLTVRLTDTATGATSTQAYPVNIPKTVGSNTAFVGFTAGTGGATAVMNVTSWTYAAAVTAAAPRASALGRVLSPLADTSMMYADCTTTPAHAAAFSFNPDGTVTYTPEPGFVGTDSFEYLLVDAATGRCSDEHATVTFTVTAADGAPVVSDEVTLSASTAPGRAVAIDLRQYVTDDDASADDLKYAVKNLKGSAGGKVKLSADRHTAVFTPAKGFSGRAGFTFAAADGKLRSTPFQFDVVVADPGSAITVGDTVVVAKPGKTVKIDVLKNAAAADPAATLTLASIVNPPTVGTAAIEGGRLVFTADRTSRDPQSIYVLIEDGQGNSTQATVLVTFAGKR